MTENLETLKVRTDGGTQGRAKIDMETVREYQTVLKEANGNWPFPPVKAIYDGRDHWLYDGFHRHAAAQRNGVYIIPAEVKQGTQRDAILLSAGANAKHGLRRTNDDKRRVVLRLLEDDEWCQWSDREIARRCHVSHVFVAGVRRDTGNITSERTYTDKHGNVATMQTGNIGSNQPSTVQYATVDQLEKEVRRWLPYRSGTRNKSKWAEILSKILNGDELDDFRQLGWNVDESDLDVWRGDDLRMAVGNVLLAIREESESVIGSSQEDETAVSPYQVSLGAQSVEIRETLKRYIEDSSKDSLWLIETLADEDALNHGLHKELAAKALGTSEMFVYHAAMTLWNSNTFGNRDMRSIVEEETAVSTPPPGQDTEQDIDAMLAEPPNPILNKLTDMRWIVSEMETQVDVSDVKVGRSLFFALSKVALAIDDAIKIVKKG
jgi:hypothetical protein